MKTQKAVSDTSRTNQLKISEKPDKVADKLFSYLYQNGKGIESFSIKGWFEKEDYDEPNFYEKRHRKIKQRIRDILLQHRIDMNTFGIRYFLSPYSGEVFFLSPNKHSGWIELFRKNTSDRERIFNLVFKFHLLSQTMETETIDGFEELMLCHSTHSIKEEKALLVWGQILLVKYNYHDVLTLNLTRKRRLFLPKDDYHTSDGDDLGEIMIYKEKNYRFERDLDARRRNFIYFMRFPSNEENYEKFKETQVYHYQNLMTRLELFLKQCNVSYETSPFQTNEYIENPFVKNIPTVPSIEIINNVGDDLSKNDKLFLEKLLQHQGVNSVTFFNSGKTISKYEQIEVDEEETENSCWKITENYSWSKIKLNPEKNYLVLNKQLEEEKGSIAYKRKDGLWYVTTENKKEQPADFYSKLKQKSNYLERGQFFSLQGINVPKYRNISKEKESWSILIYPNKKNKIAAIYDGTKKLRKGKNWSIEEIVYRCTVGLKTVDWEKLCTNFGVKISSEFRKVITEIGVKNWIRESLINSNTSLSIGEQTFSNQEFSAIYVRSARKKKVKAVVVKFQYENGNLYIEGVERDLKKIEKRFPFFRRQKRSGKLIDNQQYYVDEQTQEYISCYTSEYFTPTLIGREDIIEQLENEELRINRGVREGGSKLFPLVSYYNGEVQPARRIRNMICLDLENKEFIQYYVPPMQSLDRNIKTGFRVYHLIGKTYANNPISTSKLINHPLTALHFSTLTQNVLRISNNSQSSLIQKIVKVLIEN